MRNKKPERYTHDEVAGLRHTLSIEPGSTAARKLQRIGVDILKEQKAARKRLAELGL